MFGICNALMIHALLCSRFRLTLSHMTCRQCGHQFCWLCRGDYTSNHFSEFNPCGCPGAQFAFEDPDSCCRPGRCGGYMMKLWLLLKIFLIVPLGLLALALFVSWPFTLGGAGAGLVLTYVILRGTLFWWHDTNWCSDISDCITGLAQTFEYAAMCCCLPCAFICSHDDD